ncbi:MAG: hypothetical protein A2355_03050 [Spirochaetes bacterium RIFOXYB1_FULL_32_8]|nr:MAG: hypothetical protein A2355_03050 [Spirochaetes bacterium RIFOXYB1_FULL_32_8]
MKSKRLADMTAHQWGRLPWCKAYPTLPNAENAHFVVNLSKSIEILTTKALKIQKALHFSTLLEWVLF